MLEPVRDGAPRFPPSPRCRCHHHPHTDARHWRQQRQLLDGRCGAAPAPALPGTRPARHRLRAESRPQAGDATRGAGATRRMEPREPVVYGAGGKLFRKHDRHDWRPARARRGDARLAAFFQRARRPRRDRPDLHAAGRLVRRTASHRPERRVLAEAVQRRSGGRRSPACPHRRQPHDCRRDAGVVSVSDRYDRDVDAGAVRREHDARAARASTSPSGDWFPESPSSRPKRT